VEVYVNVKVFDLEMKRYEKVKLKVDTGATYTCIPKEILKRLNVRPFTKRKLRNFDGSVIEREVGVVIIEWDKSRAGVSVIFGEKDDAKVLGITALEQLGLKIDPITGKLEHYIPRQ